jgi:hypothetical protein
MKIAKNKSWTITKNGETLCLTVDDIQQLLICMAWSDELVVFDGTSGRLYGGPDEISVSLNGNAFQLTLLKKGKSHDTRNLT